MIIIKYILLTLRNGWWSIPNVASCDVNRLASGVCPIHHAAVGHWSARQGLSSVSDNLRLDVKWFALSQELNGRLALRPHAL